MHKDSPLYPEDVVVNKNGTLRWALVYVSKGLEGKTFPPPTTPVVFDQRGCHYEPHVFGIQAKQPLEIVNSDTTNHNVHFLPNNRANPQLNLGMPQPGKQRKMMNKAELPFKIKCEVHNWMAAWCAVFDHPYFAVSDEQGSFKIANLPPGKYTLTAWHEKLKSDKSTIEIEVGAKETKTADFEFK